MHTLPGIKEKFVDDLKVSVKEIMSKDDRQLGKKVKIYLITNNYISLVRFCGFILTVSVPLQNLGLVDRLKILVD